MINNVSVTILSSYNTSRFIHEVFDAKFVYFLALRIIGKDKIVEGVIDKERMDFARLLFNHRLRSECANVAIQRSRKFEALMKASLKEIKAKTKRLQAKPCFF